MRHESPPCRLYGSHTGFQFTVTLRREHEIACFRCTDGLEEAYGSRSSTITRPILKSAPAWRAVRKW